MTVKKTPGEQVKTKKKEKTAAPVSPEPAPAAGETNPELNHEEAK